MTLAETLRRGGLARISLARRKPAGAAPVGPAPPAATPRPDAPQLRDWIGVLAMGTGLFMAIMDVQIVTSSLTQIQGGLSASTDEIAWVQTAYLIADVVMVPMSRVHVSTAVDPRAVRYRRARLHRGQRVVRHRHQSRRDDRLSGDAGVLRRRDHADACGRSSTQNSAAGNWRASSRSSRSSSACLRHWARRSAGF